MNNTRIPYTNKELFDIGNPTTYEGAQLDEIAFPLGGIGTGMISLGGWGQLRDFEIFNRPEKNLQFDYTFFTLYTRKGDEPPVTRVLQGPVGGRNFTHEGRGIDRMNGAGLPHFRGCKFIGGFPIAKIKLNDPTVPLDVEIEAFNPFIPLNDRDSSLPTAIFLFHLENKSNERVHATLFANMENKVGHPNSGGGVIGYRDGDNVRGLEMTTRKHPTDSPHFGSLSLTTTWDDVGAKTNWLRAGWFDTLHDFWDTASRRGALEDERYSAKSESDKNDIGTIWLKAQIDPGKTATLPIFISWYNPNVVWHTGGTWRNYYATMFDNAFSVADYVGKNSERLEQETRLFRNTLFKSTLPSAVMDAVSSQISILKTPTCLRLEDGSFYAFEGCNVDRGCCEGTCTHVWNYAQALPYLFPNLERTIRDNDYRHNMGEDGGLTFRMPLPLGTMACGQGHAAADGQLGGIMKVYREWLINGDDAWLQRIWPSVKKALEFAWSDWDKARTGVMDGVQHNTYDIEFYGPNTMLSSFYLGALLAGEKIARYLDDDASADQYRATFEKGKVWIDDHLFNGKFYVQKVIENNLEKNDPTTFPKYQYGAGCLSDQLIGSWFARMLDFGDLLKIDNVKTTLRSIFDYNWRADLSDHANPQRIYALNDEGGLLLCSWPDGGRPPLPFPYSDEVWCGIEYQVASHMIYEGLIEEGLAIVRGVRDRHTGKHRNPWNEFECGNHYARSMASYALLLALSGFHYNAREKTIAFSPRIHKDNFSCFFSVASGWGLYHQRIGKDDAEAEIEILYGSLAVLKLAINIGGGEASATLAENPIPTSRDNACITFSKPAVITQGQSLHLTV